MLMMVAIVLVILILAILAWVVFIPVKFIVNTETKRYTLSQTGTAQLAFHPGESRPWELRIVGFRVSFESSTKKPRKPIARKKKKSTFKRSFESWLFFINRLKKSFSVRKFYADVDTDDVVLNAKLVPIVQMLNRGPLRLATNFEGRVYLNIDIEMRLNKLIWAFLLFLTKK